MGRSAAGVRGMRLAAPDDEVLAMAPVSSDTDTYLLVVTNSGYGKRTPVQRYRTQGRGGQGLKTINLIDDRLLAGALIVPFEAEILLVTDAGTLIRMDVADIRPMGRDTQGVRLMNVGEGAVVGLALVVEDEEDVATERRARPVDEIIEGDDGDEEEPSDGVESDAADADD
jgi:DNA gyrase subunit A